MIAQLSAFAVGKFELSEQMDDGLTLEQHLISHWKQSGVMPTQLDVPPIPYEISYIWDWWCELNKTRSVGMSAAHITYTEIANWAILLKINATAFEVRCIIALDSACMRCNSEQQARKSSK